ncbi:MAG TPA: hypothetical protein VGV39_10805 [Mesorhizobium sp.]|jgi:hypothetical protein|uniref:hypothetical protein n=1 Tax=Mesorhizobium sp. TaxID=1871066 RepID=UPI002DDD739E|nr:hypothetical protein [Mesorhizobium sp.]HEV2503558.1 hypothetical protein [Mesorhizobium sp.]
MEYSEAFRRDKRISSYWYISILPPHARNTLSETGPLIGFLQGQPELRQTGAVCFGGADGRPWLSITIVNATAAGDWASDGAYIAQFNRVEMVCSDFDRRDFYEQISTRIAEFLQWEIAIESDE